MEIRIREGFPHQRLVVVPANVLQRCRTLPLVSQIHVTNIGLYPSAPHHYVEREQGLPEAILIYCLAGRGSLQLGSTLHPIRQGHVLIIPPGAPHIYRADEKEPWSLFWIVFDGHQTQAVLQSLGTNIENPLLYVPDTQQMRSAFEEVYACLNYHYSDAGLLAMTSEVMRLLGKIKLQQGHPRLLRQSAEGHVMETVEFMQRHLNMLLTLDDLAARSGQSVSYYSKLFKQRTGQSPLAYFIQLKIRKACELLDQTEMSLREIAAELGYSDPYYFSRLFKKVQGCAPSTYRQSVKG